MKIIIADDSRVMRSIIERVIKTIGFETVHASNGQEVLDLLDHGTDDIGLVLLDWNMPILSGIDVLKNMQQRDYHRQIPVLMVSTESEDGKITQAIDAGACGYLSKPFTSDELTSTIQRTLGSVDLPNSSS